MSDEGQHEGNGQVAAKAAVAVLEPEEAGSPSLPGPARARGPGRPFVPGFDPRRMDGREAAKAKRPVRSVLSLVDNILQDDQDATRAARAFVDVLQDPDNKLCVQAHALLNDRSDGPVVKQVEQRSTSARIVLQGPSVSRSAGGSHQEAVQLGSVTPPLVAPQAPESGSIQGPGVAAGAQANTAFQEQVLGALAGIGATLAALAGRVEALESRGTTAT